MDSLFTFTAPARLVAAVSHRHSFPFGFTWSLHAALALIAGVLILIRPKLLNFIIAIYLILIGLSGLFKTPW